MDAVTLSLGSNLGNRLLYLRSALRRLKDAGGSEIFEIAQLSDVFETAPWGVKDQPHFLNMCVLAETGLPPEELLALVKGVEAKMGRAPTRKWGERTIDIDILTMGPLVHASPGLNIPHAEMHRRSFVLTPLSQILPEWVHPVTKRSVADMARDMADRQTLRICSLGL